MVRVRMLQDAMGSPDGVQTNDYKKGEEYEIPESLAEVFLREGWAQETKQLKGPSERKATRRKASRVRAPGGAKAPGKK